MGLFGSGSSQDSHRLRAIEKKLDLIMANLGITFEGPADDEVLEMARRGDKIGAIKMYRERTGAGLKEAKDAIDEACRTGRLPRRA